MRRGQDFLGRKNALLETKNRAAGENFF